MDEDKIADLPRSVNTQPLPERMKLVGVGFFFVGLFILAVGAGLFIFKGSASTDDIQIISDSTKTGSTGKIIVHVDGAINKPGVYELSEDSRVSDAVSKAGGLIQDADMARINLAAKVADGQKIYLPRHDDPVSLGSSGSVAGESTGLININTATESVLDKLPGVGPVTAQKIIASRPYSTPEDLLAKKAVGSSVFEKIKDLITY